ncbi:MAG: nucleotidyltransferase family protein [Hyphomicrobium sp.]
MINTAMILGAGLGTRMRPLTITVPKPLVLLQNRPLIDHVIDRLSGAGITKVVVNVHYLADKLEEHLKKTKNPRIIISDERQKLLDTGGGIIKALPLIGPNPFIIHNSDTTWIEKKEKWINALINAWDPDRMDALMILAHKSQSIGYEGEGDFFIETSGALRRREKNSTAPYVFAGVSIAHPRIFLNNPIDTFSLNVLWDRAMKNDRLHGIKVEGTWMHLGTPSALKAAEEQLKQIIAY